MFFSPLLTGQQIPQLLTTVKYFSFHHLILITATVPLTDTEKKACVMNIVSKQYG